jgi:eukaryotic-like serine/threonine-protein kinase
MQIPLKENVLKILAILLLISCSKKEIQVVPIRLPPPPPLLPTPTITSFEITNYCKGYVTITGTNFNPDISKDSVYFENIKCIIDSANESQIFARYPPGIVYGNFKVYCYGKMAISPDKLVIYPPVISSISPLIAGPGAIITILGQNFNVNILTDSVLFNKTKAKIINATSSQIKVRVPQGASSGPITVSSTCKSVSSSMPFVFSNKGIVYASGNSGICHAIDISSGTVIWKTQTNSRFRAGPTYNNGLVYIGSSDVTNLSNNSMYALDAITGTQVWRYDAGPWSLIPAIHQDVLYAGSYDKNFYALNAKTGQKIWSFTADEYFSNDGPTYYNGNVYTSNNDGYFYSLNATNGSLNWRVNIWPGGNPAIVNDIVYTAGAGVFYALDASTGTEIWKLQIASLSGSSPTIVNGIVYIAAENHQIYALNAANGNIIWQLEASWWVASAVYVTNNTLYVHSGDGVIGAVDALKGTILWAKALPPSFLSGECPVVVNGILFVGDGDGNLNALNASTGATIWTVSTGGVPLFSSPLVVDSSGMVYYAGDSGNHN